MSRGHVPNWRSYYETKDLYTPHHLDRYDPVGIATYQHSVSAFWRCPFERTAGTQPEFSTQNATTDDCRAPAGLDGSGTLLAVAERHYSISTLSQRIKEAVSKGYRSRDNCRRQSSSQPLRHGDG